MEKEEIKNKAVELKKTTSFALKRTHAFIIILAIATVLLLIFALFTNTTLPKNSNSSKTPTYIQTALKLTTPKTASSSAYQSEIIISTNQDKVMAIGLRIHFDPKVLSDVDIKAGNFFASPIILVKNINKVDGIIAYDLALAPKQTPAKDNGTVAIISFSLPKTRISTSLNFLSTTKVMDLRYDKSVLKTSSGTTFSSK